MIRKVVFLVLMITILFSCKKRTEVEAITEAYFYEIRYRDSDKIDYSYRLYESSADTLKIKALAYDVLGNELKRHGDGGFYLKSENKLYMLEGLKSNPSLGEIVYDFSKKDCTRYFHPFHRQVTNCFIGKTVDDKYKFSSTQNATDGYDWEIILDKNYRLIEKRSRSPLENFRSEIRVDKSKVPETVVNKVLSSPHSH
ncbi:hypothetical protein [Flagellimonas allohymeniacidonis]|uniref:Lipoprotein n=1 Tax=Flagellimonas allohymeniacidonis TaxID=2517819 RepID=A0A4Q8QDK8_9FLAO|nr:hypothetical protein [Allomuricauda hymeniacidonis]TAI48485.1 hypothetical protein EW142_01385 [Allomuricauda hymeniacidonis]